MSFHHGDYESHDSKRYSLPAEDEIDARVAELLADPAELGNASGADPAIEQAIGYLARISMDGTIWEHIVDQFGSIRSMAPRIFLDATTALRAALFEYARKELES
jgi:hypothetical protein